MKIALTDAQQRTIAATLTLVSVTVMIYILYQAAMLVARFIGHFSGVFLPLFTAMILALLLKPLYRGLLERGRMKPPLALALLYGIIFIPLIAIVWLLLGFAISQTLQLIDRLPEIVASVQTSLQEESQWFSEFSEKTQLGERLQAALAEGEEEGGSVDGLKTMLMTVVSAGSSVFGKIAGSLGWFVVPVYVGFLLLLKPFPIERFEDYLPFLKEETRRDLIYLAREFVGLIVSFFRGQLVIAFIQGILFGIGFQLVGLQYGLLIGFSLGFLNIVPYLGSMVGLAIALPLAFFQDGGGLGVLGLVIGVFVLVQIIEGYVLTPKIMGDQTGLHPMVIMVALFFWGTAFDGIIGMILAIPLTAFLVILWKLAKAKYIKEIL